MATRRVSRSAVLAAAILLLLSGLYSLTLVFSPAVINEISAEETGAGAAAESLKPTENRLIIPKLGIDLPYLTGGTDVLNQAVWWRYPERGNPERGGNFILSAHRFRLGLTPGQTRQRSPFYNIHRLEPGDQLTVYYDSQRYDYRVDRKLQVGPEATEIENPTAEPRLTLYSCTLGGAHDGREVIVAKPL